MKIILLFLLLPWTAFAACHTVSPSGSGSHTGADWNNSFAGIPGTLVRGDIYYLADGSYGANYTFSQAASGTTTIELRKAQSYDNCTATGWNTGTMGSAQAVFTQRFVIGGNYLIVNGNGTQTTPGCGAGGSGSTSGTPTTIAAGPPTPSDCGIKIDDSGCSSSCIGPLYIQSSATNYTLEYMEWNGNSTPTANEDNFVFGATCGSTPNAVFNHIFGHNTGAVYIQYCGQGSIVSNSYFWGTEANGTLQDGEHGQAEFYSPPDSNGIRYNNVYRDITGTAIWSFANPGTGTSNGWEFYDNIIYNSTTYSQSGSSLSIGTITTGFLWCGNSGVVCTNFLVYQNDIINKGYNAGLVLTDTASGGTATVQNNIWYNIVGTSGAQSPAFAGNTTYTQSYNSFLASSSSCASGTNNVCDNASSNPFVNWTSGNFRLSSDGADWNNRLSLSAGGWNTDAVNNTFTSDRGAYQYLTAGVGSSSGSGVVLNGGNIN